MGISFTGGVSIPGRLNFKSVIPTFVANAVNFNPTNDVLARTGLSGASTSSKLMTSFWFRLQGGDATNRNILFVSNVFELVFRSSNIMEIELRDAWRFTTTTVKFSTTDNPGWNHIIVASDSSGGVNKFQIRHNDIDIFSDVTSTVGPQTASYNHATGEEFSIGAAVGAASQPLNGDLAEFWWAADFLDLDVEANRRKFRDADGKPVDLGSDGSSPNDVIPFMYFRGDAAAWNAGTNSGSGGTFTMTGAVTDVVDGPSA